MAQTAQLSGPNRIRFGFNRLFAATSTHPHLRGPRCSNALWPSLPFWLCLPLY